MSKFREIFVENGEFHDNLVNQIIHLICIPQLTFSVMGVLQVIPGVDIVFGFLICLFSLRADLVCGGVTSAWVTLLFFLARHFYSVGVINGKSDEVYRFFIWQIVISGIFQFIGHRFFEKRAPATTSKILTLPAPFFVTAQILKLIGWRKEDFKLIRAEIDSRVSAFKEGKASTKTKIN